MLNYREQNIRDTTGRRTNLFKRYFWLEPKHNEKTANLKYSPRVNIQSFDFSHNGAALTTILNVDSTELNDGELITLLPEVPPFFSSLFLSNDWDKTKYTDGYFTSICQEQTFFCEDASNSNNSFRYSLELKDSFQDGESFYDAKEGYVYLYLKNNAKNQFLIPNFYDKIALFNDQKETSLFINNQFYSAKDSTIEFGIIKKKEDDSFSFTVYNDTFNPLPFDLLGTIQPCYIRIKAAISTMPVIKTSQILLNFYRDATAEELEFAKIADLCPWLENKLIDCSYFLKQGVLSPAEYKVLFDTFKNDLRIINGKLLYYSKEYYSSIHLKTTQLEKIVTTLDSLGAAFTSDVIEPYKTTGKINNIDYFREAYRNYQAILKKEVNKTPILNHNDLLTEYFNKYFNAQQRFLKNIYYFRQCFNQKIQWDTDVECCTKKFTFNKIGPFVQENNNIKRYADETIEYINNQYVRRYLSFNKTPQFALVDKDFPWNKNNFTTNVKIYLNDKTTEATVVNHDNYEDYYVETVSENQLVRCNDKEGYNSNKTYYRVMYKGLLKNSNTSAEDWKQEYEINNHRWYKHHYDNDSIWYVSALPDSQWGTEELSWPESININGITLIKDFVPVSYNTIINDYIYTQMYLNQNNERQWQIHDINTSRSTWTWWDDTAINTQLSMFHPTVFGNTFSESEWNNNSFQQLIHNIWTHITKTGKQEDDDNRVNFYKIHFPITSVTYKGPNYVKRPYVFNNHSYEYQPANKLNQTYTDYVNYLKSKTVEKNNNVVEVANPFDVSQYVSNIIPIVTPETESKYFRRVPKTAAWIGAGIAIKLAGFWTTPPTPSTLLTTPNLYYDWAVWQATYFADTKWETSGINTKPFSGFFGREESTNYIGYHDSEKVIYSQFLSAYDDWNAIRKLRKDNEIEVSNVTIAKTWPDGRNWQQSNISYQKDKETYYLYYQKIDYANLGQDYFDYYSKIGLTYSSARVLGRGMGRNKTLTYTDSYLKFVKPDDIIDKKSKYKLLLLRNSENVDIISIDESIFNSTSPKHLDIDNERISRILYYFIDNNCSDVDLYDIDTAETPRWRDYLENNFSYEESTHIYTINNYNETSDIRCILFKQEDFNIVKVYNPDHWNKDETLQYKHRNSLYKNNTIYDENDVVIDFNKIENLVNGFYRTVELKETLKQAEGLNIVWEDIDENTTKFFKKVNDNEYQRVYTIPQMIALKSFYYIKNDEYEENTLTNITKFTIPVYLHQETYTEKRVNGVITYELDTSVEKTFIQDKYFILDTEKQENRPWKIEDIDGHIYSRSCSSEEYNKTAIGNISNGEFWYLYHSRTDQPLLFETAAVIEIELTQYWEQAYRASLYCEYFLPSSWQPQSDGDINYFNKNIIVFKTKTTSNGAEYVPTLSNKYLPEVSIYNSGKTSKLPYYQLVYRPPYDESYSNDSNYQIINENHYTPAPTVLSEHKAFLAAFAELGEDMSNYEISNYSVNSNNLTKTAYYYSTNEKSGVKWRDFLQTHSSIPYIFDEYNGLYLMTYKILKQQFEDKGISNYQRYQKEQHALWDKLYQQYPGILLEDSYSNTNATTSYDLYVLAKNAFKDKQEPERGYSISLIDAYNNLLINTINKKDKWSKYVGQELKIGEGILIDANEYYDEYDDIYKTLSQYLFISDLSYSLRKNSDIQVTVNTIKYQDKLIQRLVKLIK